MSRSRVRLSSRSLMAILDDPHEPRLRLGAPRRPSNPRKARKNSSWTTSSASPVDGQPRCKTICGVKVGRDQSLEPSVVVIHGAACKAYSRFSIGPYRKGKLARELLCSHHRRGGCRIMDKVSSASMEVLTVLAFIDCSRASVRSNA